jgi:hypothetical protein
MSAIVVFDVEIRDPARYQDFMAAVKPAPTDANPVRTPVLGQVGLLAGNRYHRVTSGYHSPQAIFGEERLAAHLADQSLRLGSLFWPCAYSPFSVVHRRRV